MLTFCLNKNAQAKFFDSVTQIPQKCENVGWEGNFFTQKKNEDICKVVKFLIILKIVTS